MCNFKLLQRKQRRLPPAQETAALKYLIGLPRVDHVFTPVDNTTYQHWEQKSSKLFVSFDFLKSEFFISFLCRQWCNLAVLFRDVPPRNEKDGAPIGTPPGVVR